MKVDINPFAEDSPEVVYVSPPYPELHEYGSGWTVGRDAMGLWVQADQLYHPMGFSIADPASLSFARVATMDEALALIWQAADERRQAAIAAIPDLTVADGRLAGLLGLTTAEET
jgi:hypothetical protein